LIGEKHLKTIFFTDQGHQKSLYKKLSAHGIGDEGQSILDLGTGTGVMAIEFAKNGSNVSGLDISKEQINIAKSVSEWECLDINFVTAACETLPFFDNSFDVIAANQCWLYFDLAILLPEIQRVLKPSGKLMISHFSWLPNESDIASNTEELILNYNPDWSASGYSGDIPLVLDWAKKEFNLTSVFYYDEDVAFNQESWRGRIRASRGVSASLSFDGVKQFDREHK
jgi:SAM-dependent methyltransferase